MSDVTATPMRSESIATLAKALASAQGKIEDAVRDAANPFFHSSYADLSSVWRACRSALAAHDLAVIQTTDTDAERIILRTTLAHASGEWIAGVYPIRPMKQAKRDEGGWTPSDDPQSIGSALTYARRYALAAMVGVAPAGDDDDAEGAMERTPEEKAAAIDPRLVKIGFGRSAGTAVGALSDRELQWYTRAYTENVANPDKARFICQNHAVLDALIAVQAMRAKTQEAPFLPSSDLPAAGAPTEADRAGLMKKIKALATERKLTTPEKQALGDDILDGVPLAEAPLEKLVGFVDFLSEAEAVGTWREVQAKGAT